jgi:hypothetical protein
MPRYLLTELFSGDGKGSKSGVYDDLGSAAAIAAYEAARSL